MSRFGGVRHAPKVSRRLGLLERRADHQCDRLTVMADMRTGESWTGAPVRQRHRARLITGALSRRILMGEDDTDSRGSLCVKYIDFLDAAATNCGRDDDAIERCLVLPVLISIGRSAGDFYRAVHAADGLSDHVDLPILLCAASASVRQRVRLASSILKSLWPRPTALLIAASAAA